MGTARQPKRVLVVDDEEDVRTIVSRLVGARGYEVITAETGKQAVDLLASGTKPDLVVLDVRMPEMDGLQALVKIRKELGLKDLPIVLLTAQTSDQDVLKGYGVGADYYITKPLKFEQLRNVVDFLIGDLTDEERRRLETLL